MINLKFELKTKLIAALNLEGMTPDDINDSDSLFGDGIGLDSIDALELIVMLDKDYGIKFTNTEEGQSVLKSISSMAEYITSNRTK